MKFKIFSLIIIVLLLYAAFFPDKYVSFLNNSTALKKVVRDGHEPVQTVVESVEDPETEAAPLKTFLEPPGRTSPFYAYSSKVYKDDPALEALAANITDPLPVRTFTARCRTFLNTSAGTCPTLASRTG